MLEAMAIGAHIEMTAGLRTGSISLATIGLVSLTSCNAPCVESLVEDLSAFESQESAAAAESFCAEPTAVLLFGDGVYEDDWTEVDPVEDAQEAWFRAGWAGGWFQGLGVETTSLSQELEIRVRPSWRVEGRAEVVDGPEVALVREASRPDPEASVQRTWGFSASLPCELAPVEPGDGSSCEWWIDGAYEDVRLDLTITATDAAGRSATVAHSGPMGVEEHPP